MYKHASINRVYKLVWNHLRRMWVPVPEHKSACAGKQAKRKQHAVLSSVSLVMAVGLSPGLSNAEPTGGVVKSGSANISSSGNTGAKVTNIKQNTLVLGLEWSSFNIGRNETVNFIQPSEASVAFNRILDSQGSQILGKINAIGHVWLINPNGLFFGKDAQVNVGGLVASTLDTANPQGFGIYSQRFTGNSLATVENQGLIAAGFTDPTNSSSKMRGFVALVGHSVKNTGDIKTAEAGQIALAAGSDVNLQFTGNSLIGVSVNQNQLNAMAVNGGLMQSDGGQVILTAGAANSALASVVNNTGVMQAKSSAMFGGRLVLSSAAKDSQLNLSGRLDASGISGADGGAIETQASVIRVSDGTVVDTSSTAGSWGKWSLMQKDTDQSTANARLSSMISGSALGEALNHSDVGLFTYKDLRIDTPVAWNAPSKFSIVTQRNIDIDAPINSAHATGSISLAYGQASTNGVVDGVKSSYTVKAPVSLMEGNNFTTQLGNAGAVKNFYVITRLGLEGSNTGKDLQGMRANLSGNYALGADIVDASQTADWNGGLGFKPIGNGGASSNFSGTFDGLGHGITGLTINRPTADNIGLFGSARNATIKNITVANVSMNGKYNVGGLVGTTSYSTIDNAHTSGRVSGDANVGGLTGSALNTTVTNSDSTANVYGRDSNGQIGGLIGIAYMSSISSSHASGHVEGLNSVGGLLGSATLSTVRNSYSQSDVMGIGHDSGPGAKAGGLIGYMNASTVSGSFADTKVYGENDMAGGLVGSAMSGSIINNSYATGYVVSNNFSGGIVGSQRMLSQITNSFASATVEGPHPGGIAGSSVAGSTVQNARWDTSKTNKGIEFTDISSAKKTSNVIGLNDEQMKQSSSYSGLDFENIWTIYEGNTRPLIRSFLTPLTVKILATQGQTYNADIAYIGDASIENQADVIPKLKGNPHYVLTSKNAGAQAVTDNGLYSDQLGYLISYDTSESQIQIDKASISVSGITADNKVYDGKSVASINISNMQSSGIYAADQGSVSLNIRGTFDTKDVGDNKQVNIAGQTGGASGANYIITGQSSTTANITPATYTALNGSKTYDGNNQFGNVTLTGVNGEIFSAKAASDGVNVSPLTQNPATKFVQADGVSEVAGSLGKISNYKPLDITQLTNNQAVVMPADFQAIAGTKIYDGSTKFQQVLVTGVNNEVFTVTADANSKNTSNNSINPAKTFTSVDGAPVAMSGSGADLRNYNSLNLDTVKNNQAVITPKPLLVNGVTAKDKVYDGTKAVELDTSQALTDTSGVVAGDDVSLKTVTGQFIDKNAASGKRVDLSQIEFNGNSKENYTAATQQFTTATISPKALTVSGLKAQDKVYDGTPTAQVDTSKPFAADSGLVKNDDVQVSSVTGTFSDKNAAPDKTVALSNAVYAGADKNNYLIKDQKTSFASINQAEFTEAVGNKAYDGSTEVRHVSVTGVNGEFFEAEGKANSKNASRSPVDPGNLLVQINQVQSQRFDINNYKPLDVNVLQKNIVVIEPGLLKYVADKVTLYVSDPVEGLTGTVTGFLQKDNLENSTTGDLSWISLATTESPEGEYQITGQGLASDNYDFVQHEDNAIALSLIPSPFNHVVVTTRPLMVEPEDVTDENPNNTQVVKKTDRPVVIPTINDLQTNHPLKINSLPSTDAQTMNAATRLSSLEDDYWFLDCFFSSSQEFKKIKCEPGSQKKSPSIEIKKYPNKKLTALNSPLLP